MHSLGFNERSLFTGENVQKMKIIGTGIDIVSVKRLEEKLMKNPALAKRVFTDGEIAYCRSKKNYLQHMAGRFAAKEAVYKVLCKFIEGLFFKDMEIESNGSRPVISKECRVGQYLKEKSLKYSLSISHENDFAVAHAMFWEE